MEIYLKMGKGIEDVTQLKKVYILTESGCCDDRLFTTKKEVEQEAKGYKDPIVTRFVKKNGEYLPEEF